MMRRTALIAFTLLVFGSAPARAAEPPKYDVAVAFKQSDTNGDSAIEIDEYYDRLVDVFFLGDVNKDGFLTEEEFVAVVVIKEDFAKVDRDHDGKVSRREFVRARLPMFLQIDTDGDGELSITEVTAAFEGRAAK